MDDSVPPPTFPPALFAEWRAPRRGTANPERLDNPVWEWLVRTGISAFEAAQQFGAPSAMTFGPGWCFDRFGRSRTQLPDGRELCVAGEHEDYYDPDFFIYNDVVVRHPDGRVEILGYPTEVFPPTDFHSATPVGHRVWIIGSLGYAGQRRVGFTPVYALDLATMAIHPVTTSGSPPGWIHRHEAAWDADASAIRIRGGLLDTGEDGAGFLENLDEWLLHLPEARWERVTGCRWPRWEVRRRDRERLHLFEYRMRQWQRDYPGLVDSGIAQGLGAPSLAEELGREPDVDRYAARYSPDVAHQALPDDPEQPGVHRIAVEGVVVRYVEGSHGVQLTVEGELDSGRAEQLVAYLVGTLSVLENSPCVARGLG